MQMRRRNWLLIGAVALVGCASLMSDGIAERLTGKPAPDFALADLSGQTVRLSSLRGRPVVLSFWSFY